MGKYINELIEYTGIDFCPYDDLVNFKEIDLIDTFNLPLDKPNIDEIIKVNGIALINNLEILQTPNLRTQLSGSVILNYQYDTNNLTQTVHFATHTLSFSDFIELPQDFNVQATILPMVSIKYIYCKVINPTDITNNLTLMLSVEAQ